VVVGNYSICLYVDSDFSVICGKQLQKPYKLANSWREVLAKPVVRNARIVRIVPTIEAGPLILRYLDVLRSRPRQRVQLENPYTMQNPAGGYKSPAKYVTEVQQAVRAAAQSLGGPIILRDTPLQRAHWELRAWAASERAGLFAEAAPTVVPCQCVQAWLKGHPAGQALRFAKVRPCVAVKLLSRITDPRWLPSFQLADTADLEPDTYLSQQWHELSWLAARAVLLKQQQCYPDVDRKDVPSCELAPFAITDKEFCSRMGEPELATPFLRSGIVRYIYRVCPKDASPLLRMQAVGAAFMRLLRSSWEANLFPSRVYETAIRPFPKSAATPRAAKSVRLCHCAEYSPELFIPRYYFSAAAGPATDAEGHSSQVLADMKAWKDCEVRTNGSKTCSSGARR